MSRRLVHIGFGLTLLCLLGVVGFPSPSFAADYCCKCRIANQDLCVTDISGDGFPNASVDACVGIKEHKQVKDLIEKYPLRFENVVCDPTIYTPKDCATVGRANFCHGAVTSLADLAEQIKIEQTPAVSVPDAVKPTLGVEIPDLTFGDVTRQGPYIMVPYIAQYVSAVYRYMVGMIAIIAIIMIMYGGFRYLIGSTSGDVKAGKEVIINALVGLALTLSAVLILHTVSPATTTLSSLRLQLIEIEHEEPDEDPTSPVPSGRPPVSGSCINESTLVQIPALSGLITQAQDPRMLPTLVDPLKAALANALKTTDPDTGQKFTGLFVYSAFRSLAKQNALFQEAVKKEEAKGFKGDEAIAKARAYVAYPACGKILNHRGGYALDIHLILNGQELRASDMSEARINVFQDEIMTPAGWVRYCPEWWHFEFPVNSNPKRAVKCDRPYGTGNSSF